MRRQTRGYLQGFETPADTATVWRALTDPAALQLWYATEAVVEPRIGGRFSVTTRLFGRREATVERLDVGVRLSLLYQPNPDWPPLSDSALVEDFLIDERHGVRKLRVIGSGVPADETWAPLLKRLRTGWALAFAQLQLQLRGGRLPGAAT